MKLRSTALALISLVVFSTEAWSKVKTQVVVYKQGDQELEGYLAVDEKLAAKRPGIVLVHDWMGLGPLVKKQAEQMAELGYVAFAADIYGKGIRPTDFQQARTQATKYKSDRGLMRARVHAAVDELKKVRQVNSSEIGAMGYCFGGTTVLELARSGSDIKGVVSFHGGLDTPNTTDAKKVKAKILVLHGADDPSVPPEQVKAFEEEMRSGGVDWQLVKYSGAVHAFTNPNAGNDNSKGAAYNEVADKRSWIAMKNFFAEIFPKK